MHIVKDYTTSQGIQYTVLDYEPVFSKADLQRLKIILADCCYVEHKALKFWSTRKEERLSKKRIKMLADLLRKIKKELT